MKGYVSKEAESENEFVKNSVIQKKPSPQVVSGFVDHRSEGVVLRKQQEMMNRSSRYKGVIQCQAMMRGHDNGEKDRVQKKENQTGLPDDLKSGIENLSGYSMDDVKVHRNSSKPAQLQAHAYAQGTDIHIGPGQEKHLPHEAWHVVQQKQGRVKATMQLKGKEKVNDDVGLEKEADAMGAKALDLRLKKSLNRSTPVKLMQEDRSGAQNDDVVLQRQPIDIIDKSKKSRFYQRDNTYDKFTNDYKKIQEILTSSSLFMPAIMKLEKKVSQSMEENNSKEGESVGSTDYLDKELLRLENKFGINLPLNSELAPGAPVYTSTLSSEAFAKMSAQSVIAQDPGAYAGHGPYSHRIQWYIILSYYKSFKHPPNVLLKNMINPEFNPKTESWPLVGAEGYQQAIPEGGGTMWDALLDRQHGDSDYDFDLDGLTHPEMLTAGFTGGRDTSSANARLQEAAPNVSRVVSEKYRAMQAGGGGTQSQNREAAQSAGLVELYDDVWLKPLSTEDYSDGGDSSSAGPSRTTTTTQADTDV